MNKTFSVTWSSGLGQWVVASEAAKGQKKKASSAGARAAALVILGAATLPAMNADAALVMQRDKSGASCEQNGDNGYSIWGMNGGWCVNVAGGTGASGVRNPGNAVLMWGTGGGDSESSVAIGNYLDVFNVASFWNGVSMEGTKITKLADGNVSATSKEAVNGSQLHYWTKYFRANTGSADAQAIGGHSVAAGGDAKSGNSGVAVGEGANSSGVDWGVALGKNTVAKTLGTALGSAAQATADNAVALGANSVANRASTVSVGGRQVVDVSPGTVGTDAVNVNQLTSAVNLFGGGATVSGGNIVAPTYALNNAKYITGNYGAVNNVGTGFQRVDDALGVLNNKINSTTGPNYSGWSMKANGGAADTIASGESVDVVNGKNTTASYNSSTNQLQVSVVDAPVFDGVVTAKGGIDMAGSKITNLAAPTDNGDAANKKYVDDKTANPYFKAVGNANGDPAVVAGEGAVAAGSSARAEQKGAVAVGLETRALEDWAVAIGAGANAKMSGVAVGVRAEALSKGAVAIGDDAGADGGVAIGQRSDAGTLGVAVGGDSQAAKDSVALGQGAKATVNQSVALGSSSTTSANLSKAAYNPSTGATLAGTSPVGEVSLGYKDFERRLTNVAAGADDTDAVNVSQLKAAVAAGSSDPLAVKYVDANKDTVALAGVSYNSTTKEGGTRVKNVAAAKDGGDAVNLDQLNSRVDASKTRYLSINDNGAPGANYNNDGATGSYAMALGVGASATQSQGIAVGNNARASGLYSMALGSGAEATAMGSVAIGFGSKATRLSSVSVGGRQITDVGAATDSNDVVTLGQLTALLEGKGMLQSSSGTLYAPASGAASAGTANTVTARAAAPTADTLAAAVVSAPVEQPTPGGDLTVGSMPDGKAVNFAGIAGDRVLTGVAAGTADNQAANIAQLKAAGVLDASGQVRPVASYDSSAKDAITLGGVGATSAVAIHNVASGVVDTDAVNVRQLNDRLQQSTTEAVSQSRTYTDQRLTDVWHGMDQLEGALRQQDRRIDDVGAMSMASAQMVASATAASLRADRGAWAIGVGNQGSRNAVAAGFSLPLGKKSQINMGASFGGDDQSVGLGFGQAF